MDRWLLRLSGVYAAGGFGGLANALSVWILGIIGLTAALGVQVAPALTTAFLYPKLVWGGLWGVMFLLPFWRERQVLGGVIFSLAPSAVQLLVIFPYKVNQGFFGLKLGALTFAFVLVFNAVWGVAAGWCLSRIESGEAERL